MKALRAFMVKVGNQAKADTEVTVGNLGMVFLQAMMYWPLALIVAIVMAYGPKWGWFTVPQGIAFFGNLAWLAGYAAIAVLVGGAVIAVGVLVQAIRKEPGGWIEALVFALTFLFRGIG